MDEELGIVLLRMNFGRTASWSRQCTDRVAFKIYGGQIHAVERMCG